MSLLDGPVIALVLLLNVTIVATVSRRLLGVRFSLTRLIVAAVISLACAAPILTALLGRDYAAPTPKVGPSILLVVLGMLIVLLPGMIFLVVAEAVAPSGSLPSPLEWGRGLRGRISRSRRYWRFVRILIRHGLGPYLRSRRPLRLSARDKRASLGRSLRDALDEGGLTFVKLGQILSTRRDLLPLEVVDELATLQHQAARVPWPDVEQTLRAEFGETERVFARFDREPLAAASVAQVHTAQLRSGQEVVVKVRRPGVTSQVERDLDILKRLAATLEQRTGWARDLGVVALADGFAAALREELDLRIEARNLAAVCAESSARTHGIAVPQAFEALSTERVLVMERFEGTPLGSADADAAVAEQGLDPRDLAVSLLDYILRQVMIDGVFHADPHPGNILLLADGRLGMLDFGSVGRLNASVRGSLQRLLVAVDSGDPLYLCDAVLEAMVASDDLDESALERDLGRFMARHLGPGGGMDIAAFTDLFRIVAKHGLAVPPDVAAVFRSLGTLEGTLTRLADGFDIVSEARTLAAGYAKERLAPGALKREAVSELAALLPILRRLPRRVDRIVGALESGNLSVNVRLLADRRDRQHIAGMLHLTLVTVLAATAGVMSILIIDRPGGPKLSANVSAHQFLGYSLLAVASVLALRVLVVVFRKEHD